MLSVLNSRHPDIKMSFLKIRTFQVVQKHNSVDRYPLYFCICHRPPQNAGFAEDFWSCLEKIFCVIVLQLNAPVFDSCHRISPAVYEFSSTAISNQSSPHKTAVGRVVALGYFYTGFAFCRLPLFLCGNVSSSPMGETNI